MARLFTDCAFVVMARHRNRQSRSHGSLATSIATSTPPSTFVLAFSTSVRLYNHSRSESIPWLGPQPFLFREDGPLYRFYEVQSARSNEHSLIPWLGSQPLY